MINQKMVTKYNTNNTIYEYSYEISNIKNFFHLSYISNIKKIFHLSYISIRKIFKINKNSNTAIIRDSEFYILPIFSKMILNRIYTVYGYSYSYSEDKNERILGYNNYYKDFEILPIKEISGKIYNFKEESICKK